MFGLVPILALIFVVTYFAIPKDAYIDFGPLHANAQNLVFGLTLGLALLLIGVGAIQWARQLMDDEEKIEYRHGAVSDEEDRAYVLDELDKGIAESKVTRRKVLGRSLLGALGLVALPGVVLLADLGPWPTRKWISGHDRDDDLGRGHPAGQRRHLRADQGRAGPDRPADQRPAGEPAGAITGPSSCRRRPRPPSSSSG